MAYSKMMLKVLMMLSCISTMGCTSIAIRTAVEIDAPTAAVYAVLADLETYPDWNPYHQKVEGEFVEGADLMVLVKRPDGKEVKVPPHMLRIEENREITWGGGIKGIFYGEHRFLLTPLGPNRTLLEHDEDFSGIAVGFADLPPSVLAEGYQMMNRALKERIENTGIENSED